MDSIEYEALRRAQEMQRGQSVSKSPNRNQGHNQSHNQNQPLSQSPNPPQRESGHKPEPAPKSTDSPQPQAFTPVQPQTPQSQNSDLLGTLFEDKEKLLILALILILSGEESHDPALILALLYLII